MPITAVPAMIAMEQCPIAGGRCKTAGRCPRSVTREKRGDKACGGAFRSARGDCPPVPDRFARTRQGLFVDGNKMRDSEESMRDTPIVACTLSLRRFRWPPLRLSASSTGFAHVPPPPHCNRICAWCTLCTWTAHAHFPFQVHLHVTPRHPAAKSLRDPLPMATSGHGQAVQRATGLRNHRRSSPTMIAGTASSLPRRRSRNQDQ